MILIILTNKTEKYKYILKINKCWMYVDIQRLEVILKCH